MTPKDKAQELYTKAEDYIYTSNAHFAEDDCEVNCALMVVDEILKVVPQDDGNSEFVYSDEQVYWREVRKAIEALKQ